MAQSGDPNWQPRAEVDAQAAKGSSQVSLELFAPVAQNDANLLFVTGRIGTDERYDRNGSVTIGGRGRIGEDVAIGVNAGMDFYRSDLTSRAQTAVSFGIEGFTSVFDVRLNYRLPTTDRRTIGFQDPTASAVGVLSVEQNRLIERKSGFRLEEVPLGGANGEIGARLTLAKNLSVRASAGAFDYRDDAASRPYRGVRGGLELDIEDPLGTGGRFSLGARLEDDNRFGTQARGTVRLSIPLGRGASRDRSSGSSGLDRQMGDRVRRDYVAASGTRYSDLTSTSFAIDARTGQEFGGIYYTSGAATAAGAGTSTNPTTLGDAVARAGQNGVVVALGSAGTIATGGVTLATNQYLVGGASSVDVRHSNGTVSQFSFGGTNGIVVGTNAAGAAVTLGQGSVVRDVTVRGSGIGIAATGVGGFALDRVTIENTGGVGLSLANTTGAVVIDGLTVRGAGGAGVRVNGGSNVTLRNSVIGGGAGAVDINDAGATLTTSLSNLTLSATGGTVLDIDGSGTGTVTVASLSGISIAGGNGEVGGFAARYVTFDADTAAGVQTVNAGRMEVGTTAARIGGAGVTLAEVDGALSFADLDIANRNDTGLSVNNTKTGSFTLTTVDGTIDTVGAGALYLDPLLLNLNLASVRSVGSINTGIVLDQVTGAGTGGNALRIGTLTISGSATRGLLITGGSTGVVTIVGGSITNSGGAAVQIGESGVAGSGGTIGLDFGAAISGNAVPLVSIFNVGGAIRFTGPITGAGSILVNGTLAGSSVVFNGPTTLTASASPALSIDNLLGSFRFVGPLTIASPLGDAIHIGNVPGGVTFGDVDITGLGGGTGLDLTGAHGNISFNTLDISGTSFAGSKGIDLTGATNAGSVIILQPSTIQGVDIGVDLTNAAISGAFRYGDGDSSDGLESRIQANTPIVITGLDTTRGVYDFADVQLVGNTNNLTGGSFTAYYVLAGASGSGASSSDPGSLAGAEASGAQYIVLLNNPNGGQDVIDAAGAGGSLDLIAGQTLVSFLYTDFFAVTGATVPPNLIVSGLGPTGILNPYTGSGAAILTTTAAGSATINLANDTRIDGVVVRNDGGNFGVVGIGKSNTQILNSNISGSGGAILLVDGGTAASATLNNLNLSATGGTALFLNGAGAGTLGVTGTGITVSATGGANAVDLGDVTVGTLGFVGITATGSSGTGVRFNGVTGGSVAVGSIAANGTGGPGLNISNSSAVFALGSIAVSGSASEGVRLTGNSSSITLGALSVTGAGGNGILIQNNSGSIATATATINGSAGYGVLVDGVATGIAVSFGSLSASGSGTAGIALTNIDGIAAFGATTIANSTGIVLGSGSAGSIGFGNVDITGLGANLTGVDARNASGNVTFATLDITGSSTVGTRGIDLTGATFSGNVATTGSGTITGVGIGVDLTNAAITGSFRYGDGSNTDANGAASTISATTPLVVTGLNAGVGTYNFRDVNLVGDTGALSTSATVFWVRAGASGAGTRGDPGSLGAAEAANADIIILLNDPAGGNDTIDANDAVFGAGGTFTLDAGQQLLGFLNGDTVTLPGGAPANVLLYGIAQGMATNPFAGSGAPTLTTGAGGGAHTLVVASNNIIDGVVIANGGSGAGIFGSGAANLVIRNSVISGAAGAIALDGGAGGASAALSNLTLRSSGGSTPLSAVGAGTLTITQLSNITIEGGHGENSGANFNGVAFDSDLVTAGFQAVDASLRIGTAGVRVNGTGLALNANSGLLNFSSLSIYNSGGAGLSVTAPSLDLRTGAGTIDTVDGNTVFVNTGRIDLVLDSVVHSGTGTGIIAQATGIGTGGRAMDVANLSVTSGSGAILIGGATSGSFTFGAASSITGTTGVALAISNSSGTLDFTYNGSVNQAANAALLSIASGHNGTVTFGAGSNLVATNGIGLLFNNSDGTYNFNGTTALSGGARIQIAGGSAGTFVFGSGTSITDPADAAIEVLNATANLTYSGTVTQSNAGVAALNVLGHTTGTLDFRNATFNVTGGDGLAFDNADGTYRFGSFTLSGGAGIAILNGSAGAFGFGDVDITGLAANSTAVNLTGLTGGATFNTLDISAASATGTRGIDLTGNTTAGDILILDSSTIAGVGVGVDLTNAAMTGNFRYGDGSNTDADGAASNITATTPLVIAGLNASVGAYNFADVNLNGDTTGLSVSAYFVLEGATGSGTRSDPGSLAGAEAANATYIVLLNNPAGGTDTLNATSAGGSFDLDSGQILLSFLHGDTLNTGGGAPANVTLYNVATSVITNPFANSGAPILTTSGGTPTVVLGGSNLLDGLLITNGGAGAGVMGNGVAGTVTIRNSTISGGAAGAINLFDGAASTTLALLNLNLTASGGNILTLNGTGAGSLTVSAFSNLTASHTAETGGFALTNIDFDADAAAGIQPVSAGTLNLGTTSSRIAGVGLSLSNATGALNFTGLNIANSGGTGLVAANSNNFTLTTDGGTVDTTGGTAIGLNPLTIDMTLDAINSAGGAYGILLDQVEGAFTVTGAINISNASTAGIAIRNNTAQADPLDALFQGAVTIANGGGAGVALSNNTGATIGFTGGLGIVTTTGAGLSFAGGGTLSLSGSSNSVQTQTGQILDLTGGLAGAGGINFATLTSSGTVAGIAINISDLDGGAFNGGNASVAGATSDGIFYGGGSTSNVSFGTVTISAAGDEGIEVNGAGSGTFTATSVAINNTAGNGVEVNGATGQVNILGGAIGATNDPTGSGVYVLNGTGNISIGASITKTSAGNVVLVDNHETGTVTFSGAISATGGLGNGIAVQNVNSGNVVFSGSKTITTGANTGVNLANNTGGAIDFLNGNLAITTTSGIGFNATGGGTVTIQGTGNTITSTTGTALNVASTTIGAAGLLFRSISSNGAASGIVLNNTGTTAGLTVTGTGTAGSGGTIQNSTGDGISLTSTEAVSLAYMNIGNNLGDGIGGSNVNGFLLDHMTINGNGNDAATDESGINISGLTGSASNGARPTGIFNSVISNNNEFEIQITNSAGTLANFQLVNTAISSNGLPINGNVASPHGNLVNFLGTGTSVMGITVTNSNFTGNWNAATPPATITGTALFIDTSGTSMTANVSGSTFTANNAGINVSTGPGSSTLTYSIVGNSFTGQRSTAINDFQNGNSPFGRTVYGTIQNNVIGTNGVANSGSQVGNGIAIGNEGAVNATYLISGNTIQQIASATALSVNVGLGGSPTAGGTTNLTILNNTIRDIIGNRAITIQDNQVGGPSPTINVNMSGNSFSNIAGAGGNGQILRFRVLGGTINLTQQAATAGATSGEVDDANGFNDPTKVNVSVGTGSVNYGQPAPPTPPVVVPLP